MRLLDRVLTTLEQYAAGDSAQVVELRVNSLITLALAEFLLDGRQAALARLEQAQTEAMRFAGIVDEGALRARISYQRATIHGRAGDLTQAAEEFEFVTRRLDAFTDQERCSVQLNRGMVALGQSRPDRAADAFADAARLAHQLGAGQQEFMALHNGGYAAYLLGDLPRALSEMARAENVQAGVSRETARLDRATVLLDAGLVTEAVDVLHRGLAGLRGRGHAQVRADHHLELAQALLALGRHDAALVAVRRARSAYRRVGAEAWDGRARLLGLRIELERLVGPEGRPSGRPSRVALRVAAEARELVGVAERLGDGELAHRGRTVSVSALALAGELAAAREVFQGSRSHRHDSLAEQLHRIEVESSVLAQSGSEARARRLLSRAARTLAAGQLGSASIDLRTARAGLGVRLGALDLDLARTRGSGAVLESLERWRSATDRLPLVRRPQDADLAELTERLRVLRSRLRDEREGGELADLQRQCAVLEHQIRAKEWTLSNSSALIHQPTLGIRDARDVLQAVDLDLLWFFPHRGRLCGLGIFGGRAGVKDLMDLGTGAEVARRLRADLRVAATHRLGPMESAVWGSLRAGAGRLDEALLGPWHVGDRGIVLVTSAELSALPWSLLGSLAGRPLTVASSMTAFARRSRDERIFAPAMSVHVSVGPDLARGQAEADAIVGTWANRASVRRPVPSTTRDLVQALASPGIVHIAAHGVHQPESPLFSSVALHDGPVFAHELQPSGVGSDHVVLSACEVGVATTRPGDESLGLAASMLSLGARSVVAAVAPVPDDVAAETMTHHHRALAAGQRSDEALATAIAATDPVASAFLNLGGRW